MPAPTAARLFLGGQHYGGTDVCAMHLPAQMTTRERFSADVASATGEACASADKAAALYVLLVEDCDDDALLVLRELRRGGYQPCWQRVDTAAALDSALAQERWDIVLSDYVLPSFDAPAVIGRIRDRNLDLPVIIVSGEMGEEAAVAAMRAGAQDFVAKDRLQRLVPAVERELRAAAARRLLLDPQPRSERQLGDLIHDLDAIVWEADAVSFRFSFVSRGAEPILGYPLERWLSDADFRVRLLHPDDRDRMVRFWRRAALDGGSHTTEFRALRADGRVVWLREHARLVGEHGSQQLRGMMVDVTEMKRVG